MRLKTGALAIAAALSVAGCSTTKPVPVTSDGLRDVVGTSLIGARGATADDQRKIDETAAGLCGSGVWSQTECARHGRETQD
ncbi:MULTISPECIES: hypothetical protein [Hyphomicrobiales]|uniref:hypothetical protein n=1 Tax=Hyphomicrobiales TaxID=356 RepID=UPI001FD476F0|nr:MULTISPECIES: hypothetical protein [Hyphomicrobiales]MCV0371871.1 hypothetical protein [Filomicrobium sp.]